jgi:branched-chain amino acid transport system substrate-binding protein
MRKPFAVIGFAAAIVGSTPAGAQISNDIVKIGVLSDMSSLYSDSTGPGSLIAAQMAAADFNGKVKGKPIEVIGADHQNKPDVGSSIAREWYDTGRVDVIVDVPTSSVALAVQQITRDKNHVFLMSGTASSDLTGPACSPNGIHWTYDTYALGKVAGNAMVTRGEDTWFFITPYAGTRHGERRHRGRRKSLWCGACADQHSGLLLVSTEGAGISSQGHRTGQYWQRYAERH